MHLDRSTDHLLLRDGIGADMADDRLAHQACVDQFAHSHIRARGIVRDERQTLLALTNQFIDKILRRPDTNEATDHENGPIRYPSNGFFSGIHLIHSSRPSIWARGLRSLVATRSQTVWMHDWPAHNWMGAF